MRKLKKKKEKRWLRGERTVPLGGTVLWPMVGSELFQGCLRRFQTADRRRNASTEGSVPPSSETFEKVRGWRYGV